MFMKRHYEGGYILRQLVLLEAFPDTSTPSGWRIKYGYQEDNPGRPGKEAPIYTLPDGSALAFDIPVAQKTRPGITGKLHIEVRTWE